MWALVKKIEEDEYDVLPVSWIISDETSYYPKENAVAASKNNKTPENSWDIILIKILKSKVDNYERAMENCVRLTRGRKCITDSEAEVKGAGHRKRFRNRLFLNSDESDASGASTCSSDASFVASKKTQNKYSKKMDPPKHQNAPFPTFKVVNPSTSSKESVTQNQIKQRTCSVSQSSCSEKPIAQNQSKRETFSICQSLKNSPERPAVFASQKTPSSHQVGSTPRIFSPFKSLSGTRKNLFSSPLKLQAKCKIRKGKKHFCLYGNKQLNIETLCDAICYGTCLLQEIKMAQKSYYNALSSQLNSNNEKKEVDNEKSDSEVDDVEMPISISNIIPVKSSEALYELETLLKDPQIFMALTAYFCSVCSKKTGIAKNARDIVRTLMDPVLIKTFTWDGQTQKCRDKVKRTAFSSLILKTLIHRIIKKVHNQRDYKILVKATLSTFFTQIKLQTPQINATDLVP